MDLKTFREGLSVKLPAALFCFIGNKSVADNEVCLVQGHTLRHFIIIKQEVSL